MTGLRADSPLSWLAARAGTVCCIALVAVGLTGCAASTADDMARQPETSPTSSLPGCNANPTFDLEPGEMGGLQSNVRQLKADIAEHVRVRERVKAGYRAYIGSDPGLVVPGPRWIKRPENMALDAEQERARQRVDFDVSIIRNTLGDALNIRLNARWRRVPRPTAAQYLLLLKCDYNSIDS